MIQCGKAADSASRLAKKSREVFEELVARPPGLADAKAVIDVLAPALSPAEDVRQRIVQSTSNTMQQSFTKL